MVQSTEPIRAKSAATFNLNELGVEPGESDGGPGVLAGVAEEGLGRLDHLKITGLAVIAVR